MSRYDKILSAIIAISAVAVAGTYIYSQFYRSDSSAQRTLSDSSTSPLYINQWKAIAQVGTSMGPPNADVEIIEFSDLQCPYCKNSHERVRELMRRHPSRIRYHFIHYPLKNHPYALPAARAAECAREQGRFVELVDTMFADQSSLGARSWTSLAHAAGVRDTLRFNACVSRTDEFGKITAGLRMGSALKVRGTPTVIINGWMYPVAPPPTELERKVNAILSGNASVPGSAKLP